MTAYKVVVIALALVLGFTFCIQNYAQAANLIGDALKLFGIAYVVSAFGPQINDFINKTADQRGIKWEGTTKVVPIISIGKGTYIGAAQVVGPPDRVSTVQAVGQLEASISRLGGRWLIPVSTKSPTATGLQQVQGVGISGLIDFKI
jgi:hypothetical protein